jgi:hypothetical protein
VKQLTLAICTMELIKRLQKINLSFWSLPIKKDNLINYELTASQIIALLLSMASDKSISPEFIEPFINRFIINRPSLPVTDFLYTFVVRCSPNNLYPGEVFKNISRCSYNPNIDTIELGRCNYKKQPIFYAAATAETKNIKASSTALLETGFSYARNRSVVRFYFTLSKWKINRPLRLFVLPFSKRSALHNKNFRDMRKIFTKILKNSAIHFNSDHLEIKEFLEFISNVFCRMRKKNQYYKISSAFFNAIMHYGENIDGLIYPSAMTKAEGMNIALRKELIDNKTIECELLMMQAMQRDPVNPKKIDFVFGSSIERPDKDGNISFKHIY